MVSAKPAGPSPSSSSSSSSSSSLRWLAGALLLLYCVCALMAQRLASIEAPEVIAAAISFDLTITASALVWWLGARRGHLPRWTPIAVLSLGLALATRLPHAPLGLSRLLMIAGLVLEAGLVTAAVLRLPGVVRAYRAARPAGLLGAIEAGLMAARFPRRLASLAAAELAVVALVLTGFVRRPDKASFSMRRTGWIGMAATFGFLIAVESFAVHLALETWSPVAAWIATASSIYLLFWLIADCQAIRLYPVALVPDALWVRQGVRWRGRVPLEVIAGITRISELPPEADRAGLVSLALMEPSVLLQLCQPVVLHGPFGLRREATRIALTIDDVARFEREVTAAVERARG